MQTSIDFLRAIGHIDRVYVRCLSPKNTPLQVLTARGMTYTDKSGEVKKSTVNGYIDLQMGEFYRRYGKDYKPVADGWGHLLELNQQGYGVYFVVGHGGERNNDITHGSTLFHESDRATLEQQQLEIDRISSEFGKPTAVVKTKKSLHAYWSSEIIRIDNLATYQRRWLQFSKCDDTSLADPAQLMRLPGFAHVAWNGADFDRIQCELLQLNDVSYSLEQFDLILPPLDVARWCKQSVTELTESDADDRDIRTLAQYLPGFDSTGKWIKAKCPAHGGESSDSLHIDPQTGGFICHAGCSSHAVYNAAKAVAVVAGHRFEVESNESDDELNRLLGSGTYNPIDSLPNGLNKLIEIESDRWSLPSLPYVSILLSVVCSLLKVETVLNVRETKGKPIIWVGVLGTSNSGKSECLRTITAPLTSLQRGANEDYEYALADYERETVAYDKKKRGKDGDIGDKPRVPACREYYADDYTYEALGAICHSQKTRGLLLKLDELKAFCDFEKYGAANNRSRMLSLYDGHEIKCSRKGSQRMHIEKTAISLVGTTQYSTLSNIFANDDSSEDGLWARIVFVNLPTTATYSHEPETNNLLYTELARIYAAINQLDPMTFSPSNGAKKLWIEWYDSMVDRSIEKCGTFLESVYGKAKDRVARIALALHILHAAANSANPVEEVSEEIMRHAIGLGGCLLLETEKAFALTDANPTTNPDEDRVVKFVTRFADKGWVSARDVDRWWSARTKPPANELRQFMAKVVSLGYAIDNSEPTTSSKYRIQITRNGSDSSDKNPVNGSNKRTHVSLPLVTDSRYQGLEHPQNGDSKFVTTIPIGSDKPETTLNSHHNQQLNNSVTNGSDKVNGIHSKQSSDSVTTVTTIPNKNIFKIGDRAKLGDEIVTITIIDGDYIVGTSSDGCPIGGNINSVQSIDVDKSSTTANGYITKDAGGGFKEIISNHSTPDTTIEEGEIEYDC
jgi:Protein of unknown function (DUF3987)